MFSSRHFFSSQSQLINKQLAFMWSQKQPTSFENYGTNGRHTHIICYEHVLGVVVYFYGSPAQFRFGSRQILHASERQATPE